MSLAELSDAHLSCRDLRHTWAHHSVWTEPLGGGRVVHRLLRCVRGCGTHRWDTYNARTMERIDRRYQYDPAYLLKGEGATPSADEVRMEVFLRLQQGSEMPVGMPEEAEAVLGRSGK